MNIVIDEKYKLTSDALSVMVHEKRIIDPTKSPNWEQKQAEGASPEPYEKWSDPLGYFANVENAIQFIIDREIRLSSAELLTDLIAEIKRIKETVYKALGKGANE